MKDILDKTFEVDDFCMFIKNYGNGEIQFGQLVGVTDTHYIYLAVIDKQIETKVSKKLISRTNVLKLTEEMVLE